MLYNHLQKYKGGGQMKMMLAENIRAFRKERSLTQEQLAEALGVTAGAVYKWEAKLSTPEL
ncbi:MAG: helix-turn-helix transcriptional regulator, partial [Erysipelotrichaceae bacterium]|nr:helix-turn-helix transcriptional regulator [Erysipelotrichaceae bacterium]